LNADERLIGIQPHQSILIISNIMFARFLVMSIVLEPWAHNIVPSNAQSKQSAANFKHISSLLMHVYNMAVASLTGIPLAQLRGVTSADGLLQATDEGFQVMLRQCEDEWLQQLKSSIESWLKFVIESVSPILLGMSGDALPQQVPAVANQPAPAEIMTIPEVRSVVDVNYYSLVPKMSFCFAFRCLMLAMLHVIYSSLDTFATGFIAHSPSFCCCASTPHQQQFSVEQPHVALPHVQTSSKPMLYSDIYSERCNNK
jgi:hypothetical protein